MLQPSLERFGKYYGVVVAGLALVGLLCAASAARGVGGDFATVDFTAAAPLTYNHTTGGGAYDDRTVGKNNDIVESLEGGDFACGDLVTFLTAIRMEDVTVDPVQVAEFDFSFLADSTGQSGVALGDIVNVLINYGPVSGGDGAGGTDSGIIDDGGSVAILTSETLTGPLFVSGSELLGTVRVTDLEAGEQVILRIDVRLLCDPGSSPTGNLQAALEGGRVVAPALDTINTGAQTIPFKKVGDIVMSAIQILKTVTTADGTCPGVETLMVLEGTTVKYCYEVTNTGSTDLFDVVVVDDNATPGDTSDDFMVPLMGLADLDDDGELDDLAAGATALGEALVLISMPGTYHNTATVTAEDPNGRPVTNDDDATVVAEEIPPADLRITKTVTTADGTCPGTDTLTLFIATSVTVKYCYLIENLGPGNALDVVVVDDNATPGDPGDDVLMTLVGLTDEDGDGFADDLAGGASAVGEYLKTFDGPGTFTNCATVTGTEQHSGDPLADTDCATLTLVPIPVGNLTIEKSVTTSGGTCPGVEALLIQAGEAVKFCYTVTNLGSGAVLNVVVVDDNATPGDPGDDFMVLLVGLTDEDGDGFADDLGPGGMANGEVLKTFDDPGTFTNCATVTGRDEYSGDPRMDTDCATVTVEEVPLCVDDFLVGVFHNQNGAYILIDPATGQGWPFQVGGVDLFAGLNGITSVAVDRPTDSFYVPTGDLDDALYRTSLITALTSRVGFFTNGATNIQAMDLAPQVSAQFGFMPGVFYGISIDGVGGCNPNCFFRIDKQTGASVPIAGLALQQGRGVSFNPVTGEFWVFDSGTKSLYTLTASGQLTFKFSVPASNLQACTGIDTAFSLAHDCFGNLYTVDIAHGVLLRIDIVAHQAFCVGLPGTLSGPGGSRDLQGLDGYYIRTP